MTDTDAIAQLFSLNITPGKHQANDYFSLIRKLIQHRDLNQTHHGPAEWDKAISEVYLLIEDEIRTNPGPAVHRISFGTSGWRGIIGKDFFIQSITVVTLAIIDLYRQITSDSNLREALGVESLAEAQKRGCVLGYDNRFGGALMAERVCALLTTNGFIVHFAGESTTGVLSAALMELKAAFSINLTPSHNPMEYGGFKFNGADAGPAAKIVTDQIGFNVNRILDSATPLALPIPVPTFVKPFDALASWQSLVRRGKRQHHLDYDEIIDRFFETESMVVVIDSVHGASRVHGKGLFLNRHSDRLIPLRNTVDPTFGGIAPEPSSVNMQAVIRTLNERPEQLKLGVIIDPDADRIRFTDGRKEIEMNQFGAAAYHYLHEEKNVKGLVAKSVATSNFANIIAERLGEKVFESRVGFKEFKPVIGQAVVCFEESDGISIIGHTPEKDAYIGLLLAMDMTLTLGMNLGDYIEQLEEEYGRFFPDRAAVAVSAGGDSLREALSLLERYTVGEKIQVGNKMMSIAKVIDIDGRKMILEDGSWFMIRPSGTEPKVRFYVEARTSEGRRDLFNIARRLLAEIGLIDLAVGDGE
ncbi:MAG: phosphoglucomutase [Proteobacteria bacterium]|nr:phosphoglucomutase [Pseudomonadota bacterium]MBU1686444.1 phosphoglucomutase [Pseudomonadota bacterium]